ncbi:MAG: hypothetical protein ACOH18_00235 [Candidatus Saccharimonadaceae bacterium]
MSTKKITLIVAGTVFGLLLLGIVTVLTIRFVNLTINGAKVDNNKITSAYFEATFPTGSNLTNESKTTNNIYVTVPTEYGELRVNIGRVNYKINHISDRGKITTEEVTVDNTKAIQKTVNYSAVISGKSEKLLIRYRVAIDKIAKPSDENYTTIEATAMSKRNLTSAEQKDVEAVSKAIIQSIIIK